MTIASKMARRIAHWPPERVFSRHDFLDLGSTHAIGMALMRMRQRQAIRQVRRGYFDRPRTDPLLGELAPSHTELLKAMARRTGTRFQPDSASAANALGLSNQVPMRLVYETDGSSLRLPWGLRGAIRLRHRAPRFFLPPGRWSGSVFSALRSLGKDGINEQELNRLRQQLPHEAIQQIRNDLPRAPAWMHPTLRRLIEGGDR